MLTSHCSAASGMVAPPSIATTTRLRKSSESGFAIHAGLLPAGSLNHIRHPMGIPRFSLLGKRSSALNSATLTSVASSDLATLHPTLSKPSWSVASPHFNDQDAAHRDSLRFGLTNAWHLGSRFESLS